ncbi:acetylcholine receptor subunit alpha-like 1 isoform X2 [Convolutriloba macropyga]|uniref:acetylcholine receptor subunit alpha-like 1 isoform X2 n=1 Tax=Convolutriloba macropyga TaxID=536237 RepID=UPI003F51F924
MLIIYTKNNDFTAINKNFTSGFLFLIPAETGEKISFAITTMLAQMITYGILLQLLPASSLHLPDAFPAMQLVLRHLSLNCLAAILVVKVHNNGSGSRMWSWLRWILNSKFPKFFCLSTLKSERPHKAQKVSKTASTNKSEPKQNYKPEPSEVQNEEIEMDNEKTPDPVVDENPKNCQYDVDADWVLLAMLLDRLFLILHWILWCYLMFCC